MADILAYAIKGPLRRWYAEGPTPSPPQAPAARTPMKPSVSTPRPERRSTPSAVLGAAVAAALLAVAPQAPAQQPLAQASVDALVQALSTDNRPPTRTFRRTQLPEAGSNLCAGQAPGSGPAAGGTGAAATRTLEVVPYAGDTTPGVNLSVQFAMGSDKLTPADRALLDNLAAALQHPQLAEGRFAVAGHTDTSGDGRINLELSCARALAVRSYLAGKGVQPQRISAYGFGSARLLADQAPTAPTHRRVEIRKAPE